MMEILKIYSVVLVSFLLFFTFSDDFSKRQKVAGIGLFLPLLVYCFIK